MKRIIKVCALFLIIFTVCGCSNNTLKCEKTIENEKHKIVIKFSKDKPSKAEYDIKFNYAVDDAYIDMKLLELKEQYAILDNLDGVVYNIKESNEDLLVKVNISHFYKYISDEIPIVDDTLGVNKLNLELNGYMCK